MTQIAAAKFEGVKPMPGSNLSTAPIGHNKPPLDEEARQAFRERMLEKKPDYVERIEQLEGAAERCAVVDQDTAGKAGDLVKQIRAMIVLVSDTHTVVKAPYLAASRAVDECKKGLESRLDTMKRRVEGKQTQFLREEEARVEPAEPIKSDFGTTVSGQKVWEAEVEDYLVAFMAVSDNEKVREAIDKAIKGMVRGGMRKIEGVRIYQALKASNR